MSDEGKAALGQFLLYPPLEQIEPKKRLSGENASPPLKLAEAECLECQQKKSSPIRLLPHSSLNWENSLQEASYLCCQTIAVFMSLRFLLSLTEIASEAVATTGKVN